MKILYIQYTDPQSYPPLEHSSKIFADAGWDVRFFGTRAFGAEGIRFRPHPKIRIKRLPFCSPGWAQKIHYLFFAVRAVLEALLWRPDWVYASDLFSCLPALLLKKCFNLKIIYHEHDAPSSKTQSFFVSFFLRVRTRLAAEAFMDILPNQARIEYFVRETFASQAHVFCALNCPSKREAGPPRRALSSEDFWVLYHGSLVPSRLPLAAVQALRQLPERVKLRIVGYESAGFRGYLKKIEDHAVQQGLKERLHLVGLVPTRDDLFDWVCRSDVGLSFMPRISEDLNERTMAGASNKPFDYLAGGLALLVSDLPDWKAMYVESGCGLSCDPEDSMSIARALGFFIDHPEVTRAMGEKGRQRILKEWNYETQFSSIFQKMNGEHS